VKWKIAALAALAVFALGEASQFSSACESRWHRNIGCDDERRICESYVKHFFAVKRMSKRRSLKQVAIFRMEYRKNPNLAESPTLHQIPRHIKNAAFNSSSRPHLNSRVDRVWYFLQIKNRLIGPLCDDWLIAFEKSRASWRLTFIFPRRQELTHIHEVSSRINIPRGPYRGARQIGALQHDIGCPRLGERLLSVPQSPLGYPPQKSSRYEQKNVKVAVGSVQSFCHHPLLSSE